MQTVQLFVQWYNFFDVKGIIIISTLSSPIPYPGSSPPGLQHSTSPSPTSVGEPDLQQLSPAPKTSTCSSSSSSSAEEQPFRPKCKSLPHSDLCRAYNRSNRSNGSGEDAKAQQQLQRVPSPIVITQSSNCALLSPTTSHAPHKSPSDQHHHQTPLSSSSPSPQVLRRRLSPRSAGNSPKGSPIAAAKNLFRLSGSHLLPTSSSPRSPRGGGGSPRNSPLFGRKKSPAPPGHSLDDRESKYIHWWMGDVSAGEVRHWSQVLEKEGQWIYFWHSIRYKLKSAAS